MAAILQTRLCGEGHDEAMLMDRLWVETFIESMSAARVFVRQRGYRIVEDKPDFLAFEVPPKRGKTSWLGGIYCFRQGEGEG